MSDFKISSYIHSDETALRVAHNCAHGAFGAANVAAVLTGEQGQELCDGSVGSDDGVSVVEEAVYSDYPGGNREHIVSEGVPGKGQKIVQLKAMVRCDD